jgi:hypothetical protein
VGLSFVPDLPPVAVTDVVRQARRPELEAGPQFHSPREPERQEW